MDEEIGTQMEQSRSITDTEYWTQARDAVAVVEGSQDHDEVLTDQLTHLASRRAFDYELARRFSEWERRRLPVSLLLIALNDFDRIGAEFGRQVAGDVLRGVAHILSITVRKMDLPTHYAGEEFSVILPDTTISGAKFAAERILAVLAGTPYPLQGQTLPLTVSIGVASVVADDDESSLIERATKALDASKACGGNCIRFHDGKGIVTEPDDQIAFERQFAHARRMETVGRLAAGVAHEINTPVQYVGDNVSFLEDAFSDVCSLLDVYEGLLSACESGHQTTELVQAVKERAASIDLEYLQAEIPRAIDQSLEGIQRVARIVRSIKQFAHPDVGSKTATDVHSIIEGMLTVSANEWKYAANVVTDFDPTLPRAAVLPGEFGQVIVNLVVNAAQAISEVVDRSDEKGTIAISTRRDGDWIEIRIRDTGPGIPEQYRSRVYDQFFTTKPTGVGTGQGLAIAYSTIVHQHRGTIDFETQQGEGTTFIIRLPIEAEPKTQGASQREEAHPLH